MTWHEAPTPVKTVIGGIFVNRLGAFLQAFLVLYLIHRGYSPGQAGAALGANGLGSIAGVVAGGKQMDRIGPRRAITRSMLLTAVLTASIPEIGSYPIMLIVVTAVGASSQAYRPVSAAVVSAGTAPQRRVMAFAMYRLAQNAGTTVAPLIGVGLAAVSYPLLFWTEAGAALGCAVLNWRALSSATPHAVRAPGYPSARTGYPSVLRDARYVLFLLGMLAYAAVYIQYISVLPLEVRASGLPTSAYGILLTINGLVVIACELAVTRTVQHWPRRLAALCGMTLVAVGVTAYVLPFGLAGFSAATLIWSMGEIVGSPTLVAYPTQTARPEQASHYIGASQAAFGIGTALGPAAGAALWSGLHAAAWLTFGIAGLLAAAIVAAGMRGADHADA